jgi:hypothetical protein
MRSRFTRFVLPIAALTTACAAFALAARPAAAQGYDARRLGMGGVVLSDVSTSSAQNVAYRAVPRPTSGGLGGRSIPLPLGLIQYIADPPEFDTDSPDFNVFEIANLIGSTPYTLQIVKPEELSSDVIVDVGQNELVVDLGELQRLFPDDDIRYGMAFAAPNFEFGTKNLFVGLRGQAEARNSLDLGDELQAALAEAAPFEPNTVYDASDLARAQVVGAVSGGVAVPLLPAVGAPEGDPRRGGTALYGGVRVKYLRGIPLMQAESVGQFTTGDTILGPSSPLRFGYVSDVRRTPDPGLDTGDGVGADAGVAFFVSRVEIGLGVNDIGSTIHWKHTNLDRYTYDSNTNSNVSQRLVTDTDYDLKFPVTGFVNLAYRQGRTTLAGTLERTANERYIPRAGAEVWMGPVPVRGGVYLDSYKLMQFTAGTGFRLGSFGLDVALATQSRGITTSRGVELAASLALN